MAETKQKKETKEEKKHDHMHEEHSHADHKHEAKAPVKEEKVSGKADAKKETKKEEKIVKAKKKRPKEKSRKVAVKKTKQVLAQRRKILRKTGTPVFRGRFGKRSQRRKGNEKWNKWRFPRGIDVKHVASDGFNPHGGYRRPKAIRDIHPSGYREFVVTKISEIEMVPDMHAIRVVSGLGRKKKIAIVDKAIAQGIKVLNP